MTDGPKRQGRFLKKGSKVFDNVSLMEFRFIEIADISLVTPDNSRRTIIHSQYHAPEDLDTGVKHPDRFDDSLLGQEHMRPVILPTDFTADWERSRKLRKDRPRGDDDEFDFEYEAAQRQARERDSGEAAPQAAASAPADMSEPPEAGPESEKAQGTAAGLKSINTSPMAAVDAMTRVIQNIKDTAVDPTAAGVPPSSPAPQAGRGGAEAPAAETAAGQAARRADEFIPVAAAGAPPPGTQVRDPEAAASQEYRQRLTDLQQSQQHLEAEAQQLREAAKAEGYRDGFRMGEEKAELQARQQAAQVFGKVNELIGEFAGLKHAILDNVQQNFYELCQAMAEALLKREFAISPEAFVTVMRRAIAEAVEPGKVQIRVHPDFYEKIAGLGDGSINQSLVQDAEIPPGDFKIESDQSIVDVNVGKLIEGLLAKADLNLFDQMEKAS